MIKVFTLKKLVSQFKVYLTTCAIPSKTFIWLPFMGGISAFAVILPMPVGSFRGLYNDVGARAGNFRREEHKT
jgi:hypothetical protein